MKRLIFLLLALLLITPVSAQDDNLPVLAQQASEAYQRQDYRAAIAIYEMLLEDGARDSTIYFNLGGAYFQTNNLGRALVYYRRAQAIAPRDSDLNSSIALVRASRVDIQESERSLIDNLSTLTNSVLTLTELSWITFGCWTILFGVMFLRFIRPDWRETLRIPLRAGELALLVAALLLGFRLYGMTIRPPAVVIAPVADVMSGPGDDYLLHFSLHTGAELRILESRDGWARFVLPDGRQGWLPEDALARI